MFAGKWPLSYPSTAFRQACPFPSSLPSPSPSLVVVAMSDRDTGRRMEYRNVVVPGCHTALNLRQVALCYPSLPWCTITSAHLVGTQRRYPKGHDAIPERRVSVSKTCQRGWLCGDKATRGCGWRRWRCGVLLWMHAQRRLRLGVLGFLSAFLLDKTLPTQPYRIRWAANPQAVPRDMRPAGAEVPRSQ